MNFLKALKITNTKFLIREKKSGKILKNDFDGVENEKKFLPEGGQVSRNQFGVECPVYMYYNFDPRF